MRVGYSFCILRYVHDPISQEFVNIGVALFSPSAGYFRANCTSNYGRITQLFRKIDGSRFRQISRYIQDRINALGQSDSPLLPFEPDSSIERMLAKVLPPDDSSVQFSQPGVGLSGNLDRTLHELYLRHVEHYIYQSDAPRRTDEEVWRTFREPLDRLHVTSRLNPKRIVAPDFDYEFQRSWKNEIWHVIEPISFDLIEAGSILNKANQWLGRVTNLVDSSEPFRIHVLLGEPADNHLMGTFIKAQNILNKMPGRKEFVRESEADAFADELAREVAEHSS